MTTLPYRQTAALRSVGGVAVAGGGAIPCSVWPAESSRNSDAGRQHSHRGEAAPAFGAMLRVPNRELLVDGEVYKIVSATPMDLVPHVVLELQQTSGRS